jgi:probable rRNA maturation factor
MRSVRGARAKRIEIQLACSRQGIPHANSLRAWANAALIARTGAICIRVVGAAEGKRLNHRWRGKNYPTNVLSFPANADFAPAVARQAQLGDLVICAQVVKREAHGQGKPLRAHWAHMVVHGVLHLQGYDHVKNRDAKRMEAREVEILAGFGYQDPYLS